YGPKDGKGWGNPIIVLMGDDGQDGADGKDGKDGEDGTDGQDGVDGRDGKDGKDGKNGQDGSQIYAGRGAPNMKLGNKGDFYLDKSNYELYGPKTGSGWGSPINLKGADGNANVTRYIFPSHDFSKYSSLSVGLPLESENIMKESSFLVYWVVGPNDDEKYIHIPGSDPGGNSYIVYHNWVPDPNHAYFLIILTDGPGYEGRIEVVRIAATNTVYMKNANNKPIPQNLDVSNYNEVANYYGFGNATPETLQHH